MSNERGEGLDFLRGKKKGKKESKKENRNSMSWEWLKKA